MRKSRFRAVVVALAIVLLMAIPGATVAAAPPENPPQPPLPPQAEEQWQRLMERFELAQVAKLPTNVPMAQVALPGGGDVVALGTLFTFYEANVGDDWEYEFGPLANADGHYHLSGNRNHVATEAYGYPYGWGRAFAWTGLQVRIWGTAPCLITVDGQGKSAMKGDVNGHAEWTVKFKIFDQTRGSYLEELTIFDYHKSDQLWQSIEGGSFRNSRYVLLEDQHIYLVYLITYGFSEQRYPGMPGISWQYSDGRSYAGDTNWNWLEFYFP